MFTEPFGNIVDDPDSYLTYVTLGNHDWETSRDGGFAQISFHEEAEAFYMDGPYYTVKPPAGHGDIELFVIDTSMILASSTVYEDYLNDDGSEGVTETIEPPRLPHRTNDGRRKEPAAMARRGASRIHGTVEIRYCAPSDLVVRRQQVRGGAGAA